MLMHKRRRLTTWLLNQFTDATLPLRNTHKKSCSLNILVSHWGSIMKLCPLSQVGTHPDMTLDGLVGWSFTTWQYVGSYQDGYRLVTVHTHGNFIVKNLATSNVTQYPTQPHYPAAELTSPCPIPLNAERQTEKQEQYICIGHCFDSTENHSRSPTPETRALPIRANVPGYDLKWC